MQIINDEYIKLDSSQFDTIKLKLKDKLMDDSNINGHMFEYKESIDRLESNNIT